MAIIYSVLTDIPQPSWKVKNSHSENLKAEDEYIDKLKEVLKKRYPNQEHVGELIRFQVADGYAMYLIVSLKPVALMHLPLGDAWDFQYAHRLTKKDIIEKINQQKALAELFGRNKK
jgi:hypothetical protein